MGPLINRTFPYSANTSNPIIYEMFILDDVIMEYILTFNECHSAQNILIDCVLPLHGIQMYNA